MTDYPILPEVIEVAYQLLPREPDRENAWAAIHAALDELGLEQEFIVCGAAGYPDPFSPTPNTLENAIRFADKHSFNKVTGSPIRPIIKRRLVSDWRPVDRPDGD